MHDENLLGIWVKFLPDNAYGQVIKVREDFELTIEWLDIPIQTHDMIEALRDSDEFEILGQLSEQEELFLRLKYVK